VAVQWFIAALVVAPVAYLVVGAARGRVQVRACCPDPAHDKRLAGAFETGVPADSAADVTARRGSS
jgi:hypothetical protein